MGKKSKSFWPELVELQDAIRDHSIRHTITIEATGRWDSRSDLPSAEAIERLCRALESGGLTIRSTHRRTHDETADSTTACNFARCALPVACAPRVTVPTKSYFSGGRGFVSWL